MTRKDFKNYIKNNGLDKYIYFNRRLLNCHDNIVYIVNRPLYGRLRYNFKCRYVVFDNLDLKNQNERIFSHMDEAIMYGLTLFNSYIENISNKEEKIELNNKVKILLKA